MDLLLAQGIGFVAVGFSVLTYQLNKRPLMLLSETTAAFLYTVHFFLLAAPTGGALNLLGGVRALTFYRYPPRKNRLWLLYSFLIISVVATYIFWQGWVSLLALAGTTSYALGYWQNNPKHIRRLLMLSFPLWFVYNLAVGSYPGMLIEVILFFANLLGQYRFDFLPKRKIQH